MFNTLDELLAEDRAHSPPQLSLSPAFERKWLSLYEAFEVGRIDESRMRGVSAQYWSRPEEGALIWVDIDTSGITRRHPPELWQNGNPLQNGRI